MSQRRAPKISLGFVVRRCTLELGHTPGAKEFSEWANTAGDNGAAIFGRRINADEAAVILRHPGRPVTTHRLHAYESEAVDGAVADEPEATAARGKVVDFAAYRKRQRGGAE